MKKSMLMGIATSLVSSVAFAHPGHGVETGFMSGFLHPLLGWDHLLVMLAVGVWAAKSGGKARWQLPLMFLGAMTVGAILGLSGITVHCVEIAIAASLMAMGLLLVLHLTISRSVQLLCTALFAVMHGVAHGVELNQGTWLDNASPLVGMLIATALLHAIGYGLGKQQHKLMQWSQSLLAGIMLGFGASVLLSIQ
ncbi:MAG: urease accessory protein UreJ [Methylophilaceae bacterium 17-44-8]|nr:MAG: urease accessory protein UreJ [Methylophilaceae bacterium 17-44-8]